MSIAKLAITIIFILTPLLALSHPGGTDGQGGHTCRTNCGSYGLSQGEYHMHSKPGVKRQVRENRGVLSAIGAFLFGILISGIYFKKKVAGI